MKTTVIKWLPAISIFGCSLFSTLTADTTHGNSVTAGMMNSSYCPSDCPPKPCPPTCCKPCCKPCPKPCPPPCPRPCPPPPPPCPQPCPPPPCVPCCEPNPCCPQTPAYGYEVPCNFAILHDAGPRVCDGIDLFFTVDFIWWTARQDCLAYAITAPDPAPADECSGKPKGHVKHPDFRWKPGFKVGLGANLWHDGWDAYVQYTWLHGGTKKSHDNHCSDDSATSGSLIPLWKLVGVQEDDTFRTFSRASTRWDLHFNVIDLEIGRDFFVSRYLTLRPFSGLKITWQRQDNKNLYIGTNTAIIRNRSKTWGIGIRPGINAYWHFTREFGIFSDWAFTALMTKFNNDRGDKTIVEGNTTATKYNNSFYSLKGILELALGLRYDIWFGCNDAFHFGLSAAWEEQLWINQNNLFSECCSQGDLMLHGLTIQARLDF